MFLSEADLKDKEQLERQQAVSKKINNNRFFVAKGYHLFFSPLHRLWEWRMKMLRWQRPLLSLKRTRNSDSRVS